MENIFKHLHLTFLILLFLGTFISSSCCFSIPSVQQLQIRAGNTEACNNETLCDTSKGLECIYGSCSCLVGEGFEYNSARDRCVGRFNSQCNTANDCTDNAECTELLCACNSTAGFTTTRSYHCMRSHGLNCTTNADCNEDRHLTCSESKKQCECNSDSLVFDQDSGFCVSKLGKACDTLLDPLGFPIGRTSLKCSNSAQCKKTNVNGSDGLPTYKCECNSDQEQDANAIQCKAVTKGSAGNLKGTFSITFTLLSVIFLGKLLN